ncbi:hypothetical protein FJ420_23845 [Mesorhizobium sp. B3-1-3]|uniref:hypothetical protein n=1 Tax=unclassified Mesorhizobium TaxID=325217 RepID=UPI001128C967|nr:MULTISPECIES: hypothetical protein [unclassified Mesorhizobium]TPI66793.1 hypothetical protein FJ420_23845 [Mesorhizobium sp. B3-1-3]TPI70628.1 hypothetical protein FJ424_01960 [Mesorhizobium sp. B3-1-8]
MKVVIEFYRTRVADDARAVIGRETALAADLDNAIAIARLLARTLNMPQWPDAVTISEADGAALYSEIIAAQGGGEGRV